MILFLKLYKCIISTNILKYISQENYLTTYIIIYYTQFKTKVPGPLVENTHQSLKPQVFILAFAKSLSLVIIAEYVWGSRPVLRSPCVTCFLFKMP